MMDDLLHEMINPAPAPRDGARRRRLWTTVAIVGLAAVGATTLTTSALFTDKDPTSASIHTGTVNLELGQTAVEFDPTTPLAPGSATFLPITVTNSGSLALRYSISYYGEPGPVTGTGNGPGTGNLTTILELRMFDVAADDCNEGGTRNATTINTNPAAAVTNWPTAAPGDFLVGNPTAGQQDGDRTLPVGTPLSTESLCARVDFPDFADNEFQDTSVTLHLIFDSEQTINND